MTQPNPDLQRTTTPAIPGASIVDVPNAAKDRADTKEESGQLAELLKIVRDSDKKTIKGILSKAEAIYKARSRRDDKNDREVTREDYRKFCKALKLTASHARKWADLGNPKTLERFNDTDTKVFAQLSPVPATLMALGKLKDRDWEKVRASKKFHCQMRTKHIREILGETPKAPKPKPLLAIYPIDNKTDEQTDQKLEQIKQYVRNLGFGVEPPTQAAT